MKSNLDYLNGHLCILNESEPGASSPGAPPGNIREWYAVREAAEAEVATLLGRPVTRVESEEGLYVDEDGNPYQLAQLGKGKPLAVKITPLRREADRAGSRSAEAESDAQLSAPGNPASDLSVSTRSADSGRVRPKALLRKPRRKRRAAPGEESNGLQSRAGMLAEPPAQSTDDQAARERQPEENPRSRPAPLNLRQKLAEVRRRSSYIQKRGHNERFNYSYVTAADIAGAVGDALAELEVVVIPRLESISHENISPNQGYPDHLTRVVMTYTFMDVNSAEELTVKMPGEGRDPGDKGPYKAMTGALKYALLQSFLIATGDDPEDERADGGPHAGGNGNGGSDPVISQEQAGQIYELIEQTGTDVAKMLEYFKISKIEEMTVSVYGRAVQALKRKQATAANQGAAHA